MGCAVQVLASASSISAPSVLNPTTAKRGVVKLINSLDLSAQGEIGFVHAAGDGAGPKTSTRQHVEPMALQHQAEPTGMLLSAEILHRKRNPHVRLSADGPTYRYYDDINLGEVIVRAGLARIEGMDFGDHRTVLRGLFGQDVGPPTSYVVAEDDDGILFHYCGHDDLHFRVGRHRSSVKLRSWLSADGGDWVQGSRVSGSPGFF